MISTSVARIWSFLTWYLHAYLAFVPFVSGLTLRPPVGNGKYIPHGRVPYNGPQGLIFYQPGCNLTQPSLSDWNSGMNATMSTWLDKEWANYINSPYHKSFPEYMAKSYAVDTVPSAMICDGLGECSIDSCMDIRNDYGNLTREDAQAAYYTFEGLALIHHTSKAISEATEMATGFMLNRGREMVEGFTFAPELQKEAAQRKEIQQLAFSAVTAILLIGSAGFGLATELAALGGYAAMSAAEAAQIAKTAGEAAKLAKNSANALQIGKASSALTNSLFTGITGVLTTFPQDNTHLVNDVIEFLLNSFNQVAQRTKKQVAGDIHDLMTGDRLLFRNATLVDMIKSGQFVTPIEGLRLNLMNDMEQWYFAVVLNGLWAYERAYIVDTDLHWDVSCENDSRGPPRNKVCLPERPDRVYWLYAINKGKEGHGHQAKVSSPPGLRKIIENPSFYYDITKEDIVRSSLWVHENDLWDKIANHQLPFTVSSFKNEHNPDRLPGAFTIPVYRNPLGEAISSVWGKRSRNYPCMCGEFSWTGWDYKFEADETLKFNDRTGFTNSEDRLNFCENHINCKTGSRSPGTIFESCEKPHNHKHIGHPNKDT